MSTLRVLSIDMDFFQDVDVDTLLECYPDGHDFISPMLSMFIWALRYSDNHQREKLCNVKCPENLLQELKKILKNQRSSVPVSIAQSHLQIYNFIHYEFFRQDCTDVDITNIDMHHDMFTDDPDAVDCGNWLNAIMQELPTKVTWISHPVSSEVMDDKSGENVEVIVNNFDSIKDKQFDMIFLCRSDMWYAPHLDDKFLELVDLLQASFEDVSTEQGISDRPDCVQPHDLELF